MAIENTSGAVNKDMEREIRKQLHDLSNALTVLVGRAELLTKTGQLNQNDKKELQDIVDQGFVCFAILEKARNVLMRAA